MDLTHRRVGLLWSGQANGVRDADYPWALSSAENEEFQRLMADTWGDEDLVGPLLAAAGAPSQAEDPATRNRWARLMRYAASRGDALIHEQMYEETDFGVPRRDPTPDRGKSDGAIRHVDPSVLLVERASRSEIGGRACNLSSSR